MSNINQFLDAAWTGDYDLVSSLLSRGLNINENSGGCTALLAASNYGHERVVSLLIERGVNIDIQDNVRIL
jgi:ankyrin repeat protein